MNRKITLGLSIVLVVLGLVFILYQVRSASNCYYVNATVTVKTIPGRAYGGLNTDKDMLRFGAMSPGMWVKRSTTVEYDYPGTVTVTMNGELQPWIAITPTEFTVEANEKRQVDFELSIPYSAVDGDYSGRALFCFQKQNEK